MTLLLDATGGLGIAGAVFFVIFLAVAFVAFKMLKKTVKLAFRIVIVAAILAIAAAGGLSFWWLGGTKSAAPDHPRTTQPK